MLSPSVSDFEQNRPVAAEVEPGPGGVPEMEVCQVTSMLNVLPLSRAGSLLQRIGGGHESYVHRRSNVGAGLPAMGSCQSTSMLDVPAAIAGKPAPTVTNAE